MPKQTKYPVVRARYPRILDLRTTPIGRYMLDARSYGGKREAFLNVGEARARADFLAAELERHGTDALTLSTALRTATVECLNLLRPWNASLRDAVEFYVDHRRATQQRDSTLTVSACVDHFIAAREQDVVITSATAVCPRRESNCLLARNLG